MEHDDPILMNAEEEEEGSSSIDLQKVQEFQGWRRKIRPLLQLLDKAPATPLEVEICTEEEEGKENLLLGTKESTILKDEGMGDKCLALYNELLSKVNERKGEGKALWDELQGLWKEIEEKEEFQLTFTYADKGVLDSMNNFKAQLILRKKEMRQRIEVFIGELRKDISDIWDQCMITDEEKEGFKEFTSDQYTEEMLDIHKEELTRWQIYHKKNQEILTKIKKREEMWEKLRELESKADDPNRFVNRGGSLLQDQKMHNHITKHLPKLEAELIKLAEQFEKEHGRKMKILGREIPVMVESEWALFKEQKAAKKLHRQIPTPSKPPTSSGALSSLSRTKRRSLMPTQSSSAKPAEKRPATQQPCQSTPLTKFGKFGFSTNSLKDLK